MVRVGTLSLWLGWGYSAYGSGKKVRGAPSCMIEPTITVMAVNNGYLFEVYSRRWGSLTHTLV